MNKMEGQKHTPQPWHIPKEVGATCVKVQRGNDGHLLADFHGPDREANADLFMRAPELQAEIERLKETLLEIDGMVIVPPMMSPQGRQLVIMCNMAKYALAGVAPIGLQKEVNYLRGEIQRMRTKMKAIAEYSNGEIRHQIEEMGKIEDRMAVQLQTIAESRMEIERLTAEIEALKAAQPFPVRL